MDNSMVLVGGIETIKDKGTEKFLEQMLYTTKLFKFEHLLRYVCYQVMKGNDIEKETVHKLLLELTEKELANGINIQDIPRELQYMTQTVQLLNNTLLKDHNRAIKPFFWKLSQLVTEYTEQLQNKLSNGYSIDQSELNAIPCIPGEKFAGSEHTPLAKRGQKKESFNLGKAIRQLIIKYHEPEPEKEPEKELPKIKGINITNGENFFEKSHKNISLVQQRRLKILEDKSKSKHNRSSNDGKSLQSNFFKEHAHQRYEEEQKDNNSERSNRFVDLKDTKKGRTIQKY